MQTTPETQPRSRPYFIPEDFDFHALPEAVKLAFIDIVQPSYEELVLGAATTLERSAGVSLVFLLSLELLDQFEIGRQMNLTAAANTNSTDRNEQIARYLRVVSAKQAAGNFIFRLQSLRTRSNSSPAFPPLP